MASMYPFASMFSIMLGGQSGVVVVDVDFDQVLKTHILTATFVLHLAWRFGLFKTLTHFGKQCLLKERLSIRVIEFTDVLNLTAREVDRQVFVLVTGVGVPNRANEHRVLTRCEIDFF